MRRGFSLIEVIVAGAVFAIVATIIVQLLIPAMRSVARGSSKTQAQEDAMLVVSRISRELYGALPTSIALTTDGHAVLFLSAIDPHQDSLVLDDVGDPLYSKREVLYLDDAGELVEQEIALVPPDPNPQPLVASTFTPHDKHVRERVVARDIASFTLQLTDSHLPLLISVDTQVGGFTSHLENSGTALLSTLDTALALSPSPSPLSTATPGNIPTLAPTFSP